MIDQHIKKLIRKYKTNNPFELAKRMNVRVQYKDLPEGCRGYYLRTLRRRFIVINDNLTEELQRFVCAHELGHDQLHKGMSRFFLDENRLSVPGKYEREANEFAVALMLYGTSIEEDETAECYCLRNDIPLEMTRYL